MDVTTVLNAIGSQGLVIVLFSLVIGCIGLALVHHTGRLRNEVHAYVIELAEQNSIIEHQLVELRRVLDPDGSRSKAADEHDQKMERQHVENRKALEDQERKRLSRLQMHQDVDRVRRQREREEKRAAKKLAKTETDIECPDCHGMLRVKDLRDGVRHVCPHCRAEFTFVGA